MRYKMSMMRKKYPLINPDMEAKIVNRWGAQIIKIKEGVKAKIEKQLQKRKGSKQ